MAYRIVYKCDNPDCEYPDIVIHDPMDDHATCRCGGFSRGHYTNVEDLVKKAAYLAKYPEGGE